MSRGGLEVGVRDVIAQREELRSAREQRSSDDCQKQLSRHWVQALSKLQPPSLAAAGTSFRRRCEGQVKKW